MLNIITCIYNNADVARASVRSILKNTNIPYKLILVNNHSFDLETQNFLKRLEKRFAENSNICIVDPGKNLGCHNGWNFGYKFINKDYPFCSKIDDDTIVPDGWASTLTSAFDFWDLIQTTKLGILAADLDCRAEKTGKLLSLESFNFEVPQTIVSFSCVVFRTQILEQLGLLKGHGFYGHEESYYFNLLKKQGYQALWLKDVLVRHIDPKFKN